LVLSITEKSLEYKSDREFPVRKAVSVYRAAFP